MNAQTSRLTRQFVLLLASVLAAVLLGVAVLLFLDGAHSLASQPASQARKAEAANAVSDLSITTTNNLTQVTPGMQVVYVLTASNPSTETVTDAPVLSAFSPSYALQGFSWRGANALVQTVTFTVGQPIRFFATLGPGGFVNAWVTGTLSANATGTLTNTASVAAPANVTDPNPSNNTATDADLVVAPSNPSADLQISKTDGVTEVKTAQALSYTILVTNAGPMVVQGVRITDVLPSGFQAISSTASFPRNPPPTIGLSSTTGLLTATYDLLPGDVLRLVVYGLVRPNASANLTNTVTVTMPATVTDPNNANNAAVDVDVLVTLPKAYLPVIRK